MLQKSDIKAKQRNKHTVQEYAVGFIIIYNAFFSANDTYLQKLLCSHDLKLFRSTPLTIYLFVKQKASMQTHKLEQKNKLMELKSWNKHLQYVIQYIQSSNLMYVQLIK